MSPSAIVLNVCAVVFLTLLFIFTTYLIVQARKLRLRKTAVEAKQMPLFIKPQPKPIAEPQAQLQFADAK